MNPNVLIAITQGANLVTTGGPVLIGTALQLVKIFRQGGADTGEPFEIQIQQYRNGIQTILDKNDELIADWLTMHPETESKGAPPNDEVQP